MFAIETLVVHIYKSVLHPFSFVHAFPTRNTAKAGRKPKTSLTFSSPFKNSTQYMATAIRSGEMLPTFPYNPKRERKFDYSYQHENSAGPTIS